MNVNITFYFILFFLFIISPFFSIAIALLCGLYLFQSKRYRIYVYILISLAFGLLAYTQKTDPTNFIPTDVTRYYEVIQWYSWSDLWGIFYNFELNIIFKIINIVIYSSTNNIQLVSLFWVFISYFFYFLAAEKIITYKNIKINYNYLIWILASIFGFILFTQVSEIMKQSAATSIYFYGISCLCLNEKNKGSFFIILSVFIHSSVLLLLPLLFYKRLNVFYAVLLLIGSIFLMKNNLFELLANILPTEGLLSLYQKKADAYRLDLDGFESSIRYILLLIIQIILFIYRFIILENNKVKYFYYIYICFLIMNYSIPNNFIRYIMMSHFIYGWIFLGMLSVSVRPKAVNINRIVIYSMLFLLVINNYQYTMSRTVLDAYKSIYMDNSILKILTSNVYDFLTYKAW